MSSLSNSSLATNITTGSFQSLPTVNSLSGGINKRRQLASQQPQDVVELAHDRMVSFMTASSQPQPSQQQSAGNAAMGGSSSAPSQYLQEALADSIEHRLPDQTQYMYHYLRHLQLVLSSDIALFSSGGAGAATPTPNGVMSIAVPFSSSTPIPTASRGAGASPPVAAAPQPTTAAFQPSSSAAFSFFDRLHRYVFQQEGARAMRTTFFIFQHADEVEHALASVHNDPSSAEEGNEAVPSFKPPSSSEAIGLAASKLAYRAGLFSSFTDIFYVSQRLDQSSSSLLQFPSSSTTNLSMLPANESSQVPFGLMFAFVCGMLEERLSLLAGPHVLLNCVMSLIRWCFVLQQEAVGSGGGCGGSQTHAVAGVPSQFEGIFKAFPDWLESASNERAKSLIRSIVKFLEDVLRCGPTTIVTATTRKKKQDVSGVAGSFSAAGGSLSFTSAGPADTSASLSREESQQQQVDESLKEGIAKMLDTLCGLTSATGSGSSSPPRRSGGGSFASLSNSYRHHVDLNTFETFTTIVRRMVGLYRNVSLPIFTLLESRCALTTDCIGSLIPNTSSRSTACSTSSSKQSTSSAFPTTASLSGPPAIVLESLISVLKLLHGSIAFGCMFERACSIQTSLRAAAAHYGAVSSLTAPQDHHHAPQHSTATNKPGSNAAAGAAAASQHSTGQSPGNVLLGGRRAVADRIIDALVERSRKKVEVVMPSDSGDGVVTAVATPPCPLWLFAVIVHRAVLSAVV